MTSTSSLAVASRQVLPDAWQVEVHSCLQPDENATAWLEVDLDGHLRFVKNAIILTDQRVLSRTEGEKNWSSWALQPGLSLKLSDHAGVGCLALSHPGGQLAVWRFTLGLQAAVARWVAQFESQVAQLSTPADGRPLQSVLSGSVCPVCQTVMRDEDEECPSCGREDLAPPSTWTLLKLWRFARPYQSSLLAGFSLTLAATASQLALGTGFWPTTAAGACSQRPMQGAAITRTCVPRMAGRRASRSFAPAISQASVVGVAHHQLGQEVAAVAVGRHHAGVAAPLHPYIRRDRDGWRRGPASRSASAGGRLRRREGEGVGLGRRRREGGTERG